MQHADGSDAELVERARAGSAPAFAVEHPRPPEPAVALDADQLDRIWSELDPRWPDSRAPRSLPRWVGWGASIVALAALAVLVPHAVFALGAAGDANPAEPANLVARPFEEELDEPAPPKELDENLDPPAFEFPAPDPGPATDEAS